MNNERRKARIAKLRLTILDNKHKLSELIMDCEHDYQQSGYGGSAVTCIICNSDGGWYCPVSPNRACDYAQEDGTYDEDECRYCGAPEERQ
jgi:hypothetical protein